MLKRDFTKSNKEYFKKNKIVLISVAVFLLLGIIIFSIFGMNGNFEINGYNEFSITVGEKATEKFGTHQQEIGKIVNSFDGKFDNVSIYGEGDNTKYVVRYLKDVNGNEQIEINKLVAEKLGIEVDNISEHMSVGPVVKNTDYIYTAVAILLIVVITTIFAYARYNGASALSVMLACLIGTLAFMSIGAILRLSVGMSYFAMLIILNVLIAYFAINLFETMHKSSWLMSGDYDNAMQTALKASKFRMSILSVSIMLIGVLFVLLTSSTIKYAALNIMFMAVVLLAVGWYVVPFVWNVFISYCRKREYKVKASAVETKK
ncbi:MAG: hypothetical protein IJ415_03555 [Clostridia bacterium]|nr:hypothetical protein [Clostridia bacterium]